MNRILYDKSMALCDLPYVKVRLMGTTAEGYLYQIVTDTEADWVINIDEDAFVSDLNSLKSLITYCVEHGYDNCGMPDGGVVHLRDGNPLVTNPYFNILNTKAIRERFDEGKLDELPNPERFAQKELLISPCNFNNTNEEPYYPFFIWMSNHFKTLYLKATNHPDGESTVLCNHLGEPFLIHTWYSRYYNHNRFHTNRIDSAFKEACGKQGIRYRQHFRDTLECLLLRSRHYFVSFCVKIKKKMFKP